MMVVIFELETQSGKEGQYFDLAARLQENLLKIDGFISIERFLSLNNPGRYLSLSFWRDEDAVRQWRTQEEHQYAQRTGRETIFQDYRLRVAEVVRDYGMRDRVQAP